MDWDTPYVVSRSLTLQLGGTGQLISHNSVSLRPQVMELDALPVLLAFASARTPREALAALQEEWELEAEGFAEVVDKMIGQSILKRPGETADEHQIGQGFASVLAHYGMVRDTVRVMSYRAAIQRHCRDQVVVEIGCGSGILSIFAAQAGARRVIAIEESQIVTLAREMLRRNGCDAVVDLRLANSRDVELDEPADVVIHEILGSDPFSENLLTYVDDARRRLLRPGGRLIPARLEVACAGIELESRPNGDRGRAMAEMSELAGLYGVDFEPFRAALAAAPPASFLRPLAASPPGERLGQKILTGEVRLFDVDFQSAPEEGIRPHADPRLVTTEEGVLGGLVVFFRAHLDESTVLTTSPWAPRTHWGWDLRPLSRQENVVPGQEIRLRAEVRTVAGLQQLHVDVV